MWGSPIRLGLSSWKEVENQSRKFHKYISQEALNLIKSAGQLGWTELRNFHQTVTILHDTALHCTTLQCIALHCTALQYTALHYIALHCTSMHWITQPCTSLYWTALHYTTMNESTLHSTALNYTALYCTALHCTALHCHSVIRPSPLQHHSHIWNWPLQNKAK